MDEAPAEFEIPGPPLQVIAGIDEAGLGPMLGPLTIGWSALRFTGAVPEEAATAPWRLLAGSVHESPAGRKRNSEQGFVVADSKVVFDRSERGHRRLEATALAFLNATRSEPLRRALDLCSTGPGDLATAPEFIASHPWYAKLGALPRWCQEEPQEREQDALSQALLGAQLQIVQAGVRVVPAGELNRSFAETDNKSTTVWQHCSRIMAHLFEQHGSEGLDLIIDRQGGRTHYAELLRGDFPKARLRVLREGKGGAEYFLRQGSARMRVRLMERAEESSFCTALASCFAKYARELCMTAFNGYFRQIQQDLKPTAGYVSDGRRWLEDAKPALGSCKLAPGVLVRER